MSFVDFLNWLWQQIGKVLDWFGSSYNTLRNAAANAWNWAVQQATNAYNNAKAYIIDRVNAVIAFVNFVEDYAIAVATDFYHEAINFARSELNRAYDAVEKAIDYVVSIATNFYHQALDRGTQAYNNAIAWAGDQLDSLEHSILHIFNPLLPLISVLSVILSLTRSDTASKLLNFVGSLYGQVLAFFGDPLGFMLGLIWSQAVTFFCYVLGYGLGSVSATLPPVPVWGKGGGGGGGIEPPPDIPPGNELTRPVDPLYVSGYTFTASHKGTDFGIVDGQEIHAAHNGVITFAGWDTTGYGNRVDITGTVFWSRYGHNKQILVTPGQVVTAGQVIAYGNSTGNSTGSHLHFELKIQGAYVDPVMVL